MDHRTGTDELTFEEWKAVVDSLLQHRHGLSSLDLPDVDYWTMWDEGDSPHQAAEFTMAWAFESN